MGQGESMKPFFKPEDFLHEGDVHLSERVSHMVARLANAKLQKLIEASPVVYGHKEDSETWTTLSWVTDNCSARLIYIEPIVKECLQHEPEYPIILKAGSEGSILLNGTKKCKHCGVELKATWEAVK